MRETTFTFPPPPPPPPPSHSTSAVQYGGIYQDKPTFSKSFDRTRDYGAKHRGGGPGPIFSGNHRGGRQQTWRNHTQDTSKTDYNQSISSAKHRHGISHATTRSDPHERNREFQGARGRGPIPSRKTWVAPAVPSFGGPLPQLPVTTPNSKHVETSPTRKKQKRSHNQLGLTPAHDTHDDGDDDTDEEARLATVHEEKTSGVDFTYRGELSSLKTPAEIAAWISERKKRYPTQARVEQEKKRQNELHELRHAAIKAQNEARAKRSAEGNAQDLRASHSTTRETEPCVAAASKVITKPSERKDAVSSMQRKIEKLEQRLAREKSKIEVAASTRDTASTPGVEPNRIEEAVLAPEYERLDREEATSAGSTTFSEVSSSSEDDSNDSTSVSDSTSSDDLPDSQLVSRQAPQKVPPPQRRPAVTPICRNVARFGRCKRLGCRFRHETSDKRQGSRENRESMSLYQKLVQQEKAEEDKTILGAIIYLGQHGRLGGAGSMLLKAEPSPR